MRRPPLAFFTNEEKYTPRDSALLLAHKTYESEQCSCGFRRSVCSQQPDRHQWFEVDESDLCHVEAAVEDFKSSEGYKAQHGARLSVVLMTADRLALDRGEQSAAEADTGQQ